MKRQPTATRPLPIAGLSCRSDNNVFAQHGIEGLVIATSMNNVHTCQEYCSIPEIAQVSRILLRLLNCQ